MADITVGTNSWVTITESNNYLENKIGADDWESLTTEQKTAYLISAFRYIRQKYNIELSSTEEDVKNAQIETAWWMYTFWTEYTNRQNLYSAGVRDFSISKFSEKLEESQPPQFLEDLLGAYNKYGVQFPLIERELE